MNRSKGGVITRLHQNTAARDIQENIFPGRHTSVNFVILIQVVFTHQRRLETVFEAAHNTLSKDLFGGVQTKIEFFF